ncbi:PD-(D/E)XK nuclease family protein [Mycobacterium kansasii]
MTTVKLQNTEIPRDRWGRPMVILPGSRTKRVPYRRVTTFVGCLEDTYNLMAWKNRHVVYGMGQRKDLVLAAAAADPDDKRKLNEIAEKATEHAMASASATTGTALHALTERVDRGQPLGYVPTEYQADIDAYQKATESIEWLGIESFRVHDNWQVAGTADRVGRDNHGRVRIFDVKTGTIDYPHKMCMQLAMYARSIPYNIETDTRTTDSEPIDLHRGVIIHLPAGQGRCDLYEIDIVSGWAACKLAKQVWEWRATKDLTKPIDLNAPPSKLPTWESLARDARNIDDIRLIWRRASELDQLTPELRALCTRRSQELQPTK